MTLVMCSKGPDTREGTGDAGERPEQTCLRGAALGVWLLPAVSWCWRLHGVHAFYLFKLY